MDVGCVDGFSAFGFGWFDRSSEGESLMAQVPATVVCPICGQCIWENPRVAVALPHCDSLGHVCPMSGQPLGSMAPVVREAP